MEDHTPLYRMVITVWAPTSWSDRQVEETLPKVEKRMGWLEEEAEDYLIRFDDLKITTEGGT